MDQPRIDIPLLLLMVAVLSGVFFIGFMSAWWSGKWGTEATSPRLSPKQ